MLWAGEPVTYEGRFSSLDGVTLSPPPTRPSLDIWLGGSSPAALRRTGRIADGWLGSFVSPAELASCVERIVESADEAGREIDDDHYGTTLFSARLAVCAHARGIGAARGYDPRLALEDHVAIGASALHELIEPLRRGRAPPSSSSSRSRRTSLAWLEEIRVEVVAPSRRSHESSTSNPTAKERA